MSFQHATPILLLCLVVLLAPVFFRVRSALRGEKLHIRRIRGIDAVDEACGRAAEMGRPVVFTSGLTNVGPLLYACLGVLSYVAQRVARYRTRLIVPQNDPQVLGLTSDTLKEAYQEAGRPAAFDSRDVPYLSDEQFAFAAGYLGLVERENAGSAFLLGSFAAESLMLAEAGQNVGAMQIAGTVSPEQTPFFICTCDYTLIGEEIFAASAYLSNEPIQVGSLAGQDRAKLLVLVSIVVSVLFVTAVGVSSQFGYSVPAVSAAEWLTRSWSELFGGAW